MILMNNCSPIIKNVIRLLSFLVDDCPDTFGDWLNNWFELYKVGKLKDRSLQSIRKYIDNNILPHLGSHRLCELSGTDLQAFINNISAGNTRQKIALVLDASLKKAVALQKILYNPFDSVDVPGYRKGNYRALEFEEQNAIWNYYCNPIVYHNYLDVTPYKSLFFFMCCTGLRIGEFLALDWSSDFNRDKLTISINKSMDKETGHISSPKTENSIRVIKVLPELLPYIDVIKSNTYTYYGVSEHFRKLYKRLGIKCANVHSFRHTFVSMSYAAGMREKYIQQYVGHSDVTTTLRYYTHIMERGTSAMFDYIEDLAEFLQRR